MVDCRKQFRNWLNAEPTRKEDLPHWEEFINFDNDAWSEKKESARDKLWFSTLNPANKTNVSFFFSFLVSWYEEGRKDFPEYLKVFSIWKNTLILETRPWILWIDFESNGFLKLVEILERLQNFEKDKKEIEKGLSKDEFLKSLNSFERDMISLENVIEGLGKDIPETDEQISDSEWVPYEKLEEKITQLQQENTELVQKLKDGETALTVITLSSALLSGEKNDLEAFNQKLKQEFDGLKSRLENYEKEIQELLKNKARLEIENEKSAKNNQELKIQLNQQKDKISRLEGDISLLTNQLNNLEEELEITPTEESPEKKTLSAKINFFENWWKKTKQEKEEITENLQKEQEQAQTLRQSLSELEEQLKNTGDDNLQQIQKLAQESKNLKKKVADHEINLKGKKSKIEGLEQELANQKSHAQKLGLNLTFYQKQIANQQKENKILNYCLTGAVVIIVLGIGYYFYRKFKN